MYKRQPFTYDHRSPFTYTQARNKQSPYIAQAQTNIPYIHVIQTTYNHRSPLIYQHTYSARRPIGPVAKVKGVFIKEAQGVSSVQKVFSKKDSSTVEKIHQRPTTNFDN